MVLSPALANRTVTRRRAPTVTNRYGDPEPDWANAATLAIVGCAVQPAGSSEITDETRTAVTDRWNLFAPPGTDLRASDRIDVDGLTYEVDGKPHPWAAPSGTLDHVAATLKRVEG